MGCEAQSLDAAVDRSIPDIAIRLADEGVPLRAIARAIKVSSDVVRERLQMALATGRLIDLPREDWPPGYPRDQRVLQLSRLAAENRDALLIAMQEIFGLTPTEIGLLLTMIQHLTLAKGRINDMTSRTIDVHICRIRQRLAPHGVEIKTLWGQGYQFSPEDRRKIMDMILGKVTSS
jgi:hypothetical protein